VQPRRGGGRGRGKSPPPKFWVVGKFPLQNAKFGAKNTFEGKLRGNIKIFSTHNLLCWKFAAVW